MEQKKKTMSFCPPGGTSSSGFYVEKLTWKAKQALGYDYTRCKVLLSKVLSVPRTVIYPDLFWKGDFDLHEGNGISVVDLKEKPFGLN